MEPPCSVVKKENIAWCDFLTPFQWQYPILTAIKLRSGQFPYPHPPLARRAPSLLLLSLKSAALEVVRVVVPPAVVQRVGRLVGALPQQPRDPHLLRVALVDAVVRSQQDLQ